MAVLKYTNTTEDGEITGQNPDATSDYFLIADYNRDKNYWHEKICQALKAISANPTNDYQIIYGGVVSDSGSSQIDISAGIAIGKDVDGNFRVVHIPALTNIALPSGWNDNRQIWVVGKYEVKLSTETRTHVNGETYHYILTDSYLGEADSDDLFVDADPGASVIKWGSFKMNGSTFADQNDRTTGIGLHKPPILHVVHQQATTVAGGTITSGAWRTVPLNTTRTNTLTGASLGSNQITLPRGEYEIDASTPVSSTFDTNAKARLYNITDSANILIGDADYINSPATGYSNIDTGVRGRFTLTKTTVIEFQIQIGNTTDTNGFGYPSGFSEVEVYAYCKVTKIA